jgi:hypothetical protein
MTKKLFCQLNHGILKKITELKKKIIKITFLSAKSWIFTSVILWGADNKIEKKATLSQKTRVIYLELQNYLHP